MIEPLRRATIKVVKTPIDWIRIEGAAHRPIRDLPAVAFFQAVRYGDPWDTEYARELLSFFQDGLGENCRDSWARRIEALIEASRKKDALAEPLPARVNADGRFELLDGHHRAAQAIVDGVTSIALEVKYASPLWLHLDDRLQRIYGKRKLYQRIEHPWFDDWEVARSDDRGGRIINTLRDLGVDKRNCLDIGCCTGRICRMMSEEGYSVYGVDRDDNVIAIADQLNLVLYHHVNYTHTGDIAQVVTGCGMSSTNVVICMSVLHHFLWEGDADGYLRTMRLLIDNSRILFFDHVNDEDTALIKTKGIPTDAQELCSWVRERTGCRSLKVIGTFDERPLFACSKRLVF